MSVLVELLLVLLHLGGEVLLLAPRGELLVPAAVPVVEGVAAGVPIGGIAEQTAVDGRHGLLIPDEDGAVLGRGLQAPLAGRRLGFSGGVDVEAVEALLENIERRVGGMDLDALVQGEMAHPEIGAAFREVDLDALLPFRGQEDEFDLGVVIEAEIVPSAEVDLGLAALRSDLVSLNEGQVDLPLFVAQVRRPLDIDRPADIAEAGEAVGVISFVLGHEAEGDRNDEYGRQKGRSLHHLVHRFSPSAPIFSNYRASLPPRGETARCPMGRTLGR